MQGAGLSGGTGLDAGLRFDRYDSETMLRLGPDRGPTVVVALPLFEEANRTRATAVAMLRALADRGIVGALPDLPGQGDSPVATVDARLADWRAAFAAAVAALPGPVHVAAFRAGALIDADAAVASRWYCAPMTGAAQRHELDRVRALADDELFAGNDLSPDLLASLDAAEPATIGPVRVVRLTGDPRPADATLAFAPPWRSAEPGRDDALAAALAGDIAGWIATCGGR